MVLKKRLRLKCARFRFDDNRSAEDLSILSAFRGLQVHALLSLSSGYLTPKQTRIWDLKRRGVQEVNIGRSLRVTRQTVHKAAEGANTKIAQALIETARLNRIKVTGLNAADGVLVGHSSEFKTQAIVTFSARNGVQVWYKHEGDCNNCDHLQDCRKAIVKEMEDRGIKPVENLDSTSPSRLAEILLKTITGEQRF